MTFALLLEFALKGLLCATATLVAVQLLKNRSAAERSFVAHLGLGATLAVPALSLLLPSWHVPVSPLVSVEGLAPLWLYFAPALLLGTITLVAVARLFVLRGRAMVLVEPVWLGALAHAQRRMGFKSGAALLVSSDIESPVSWGLFRPTIVLDERALASSGEAEPIISHELAHVARADWAKLLLARVATSLHWFDPVVWMLARQCHELREEAADDAVLNHDIDSAGYAAVLVGAARHECRGLLLAAHGVAPGKGSLRRRIARVLDTTRRRAPAGSRFALIAFFSGLTLGWPLAAMTMQQPPRMVARTVPHQGVARAVVATAPAAATRAPEPALAPTPIAAPPALIASVTPVTPHTPLTPVEADAPYSLDDLATMRAVGISPEWLRQMRNAGYRNLTVNEMAAMATQGVTPEYIGDIVRAGIARATPDQLVAMRIHGVTPDYVRKMAAAGYRRATPDELVAMRVQGIAPEFIRAMASEAGGQATEAMQRAKSSRPPAKPPVPPDIPSNPRPLPPDPPEKTAQD